MYIQLKITIFASKSGAKYLLCHIVAWIFDRRKYNNKVLKSHFQEINLKLFLNVTQTSHIFFIIKLAKLYNHANRNKNNRNKNKQLKLIN